MSSKRREPNQPRHHVFDGIFEYDNDLPRWWVALFVITIVFSAGYLAWYHLDLFPSRSLAEEYDAAVAEAKALADARAAAAGAAPFDYAGAAKDPAVVAAGKETFQTTCAPCHGAAGQGIVGPNLTDDFWIHGHRGKDVEAVIANGALDKGMPAWKEILGPEKVRQTVAYIFSLKGTTPPEPKPPQGEPGVLE